MKIIEMSDKEFEEYSKAYTKVMDCAREHIVKFCCDDEELVHAMRVLDTNYVTAHFYVAVHRALKG